MVMMASISTVCPPRQPVNGNTKLGMTMSGVQFGHLDPMQQRLQKIISQSGLASRRGAETLILAGRVMVNGQRAHLGQGADLAVDRITIDGREVRATPSQVYFLVHKPLGVICTCSDPQGRPTVPDLIPAHLRDGVHPVGRLDLNSTGALVLTNDGQLTYCLTHPQHQIPKTYEVLVQGRPSEGVLQAWRQGVLLDRQLTAPARVQVLGSQADQTLLEVVLREGRNRQIRRVAEQLGHVVLRLHRTSIGSLNLGGLPYGASRPLTTTEIAYLKSQSCQPQ